MKYLTLLLAIFVLSCSQSVPNDECNTESVEINDKIEQDHIQGMLHFISYCAGCHGLDGEGGAGPNLTDDYFIYGSQKDVIRTIIINGSIDRGMPEWGFALNDRQLSELVDYVKSIQGQNLEGKAPEGVRLEAKSGKK